MNLVYTMIYLLPFRK